MAVHKANKDEGEQEKKQLELVPMTPKQWINQIGELYSEVASLEEKLTELDCEKKELTQRKNGLELRLRQSLNNASNGQLTIAPIEKRGEEKADQDERFMDQSSITSVEELDGKSRAAGD